MDLCKHKHNFFEPFKKKVGITNIQPRELISGLIKYI